MQQPQLPLISADAAGELVVQGILTDAPLILTDALAQTMREDHVRNPAGFLRAQIDYLENA